MSITRKNVGGIVTVKVKAEAVIAAGGFVMTDATGYAVPGANTAGLKFIGIAVEGKTATGLANGALQIKVYTRGQFKMAATSITQAMVGSGMYVNGPATFDDTTSQLIMCGMLMSCISATLGWIDINAAGAAAMGATGAPGAPGAPGAAGAPGLPGLPGTPGAGLVALGDYTTSLEDDKNALALGFLLANEMRTKMNAHAADGTMHTTLPDSVNFPVVVDDASNIATLKALTAALLTAYAAHHVDARLAEAWAFHAAQGTAHALDSAVAPTNLQQTVARLNDLKAKFNAHDTDAVAHGDDSLHQSVSNDVTWGTIITPTVPGVEVGDKVFLNLLNDGTNNVTIQSGSLAVVDGIDIVFSASPGNDAVISYLVARL